VAKTYTVALIESERMAIIWHLTRARETMRPEDPSFDRLGRVIAKLERVEGEDRKR
jgi:hypothetical protein